MTKAEDGVAAMLRHVGEDPDRDGLTGTPRRVVRAFEELTDGYFQDPADVLCVQFDVPYDEMVVCSGISFVSLCEHHLLPFVGTATLGYLPGEKVVGLSKLARLVEIYAHRLQVQERMTVEIMEAMVKHLNPAGVGVVVRGHHACMAIRGVKQEGATMTTSALYGSIRDEPETRAEFLAFARDE